MTYFIKKTFLIINIFIIFIFAANAEQEINKINKINNEFLQISASEHEKINVNDEENPFAGEESVIISIINFGRNNPFKLYKEEVKKEKDVGLNDIPYPPSIEEDDISDEIRELMASKVNGILYDPYAKSVAIVNIKGSDYMMHKGDIVHEIMVANITKNNITLKYGENSYTVGVGEIAEGNIEYDSVKRKEKIFAQTEYSLPDLELEE